MRCRVTVDDHDCGQPAAVGIVVESLEALEFHPVCVDHAPEEIHEAEASMSRDEFAVVSLAYVTDGRSL